MKVLSWNCRGIGNDLTVRRLKEMCLKHRPRLLFLSETKNRKLLLQDIQADLGFNKLFTVEALGQRGGLALFFMDEFQVDVLFSINRMIDIKAVINGINVYMTFVYGDPVLEKRDQAWERLTRFSTTKDGPWFMIGDFNEITGHHEKEGGRKRSDTSFLSFNQMISYCGMLEFPCIGNQLSWAGKRTNGTVCWRLNRALGNEDWHEKFPHSKAQYLRMWGSDHRPVLVDILSKPTRKRTFKFNKRWLESEEIQQVILDGWNSPELSPNANIMDHISYCMKALAQWKRERDLNSAKLVEDLKAKVDNLYSDNDATTEEIAEALKELTDVLKAEEQFWKRKSRILWLLEGDLNTKFFNAITKKRRARNKITSLIDSEGNLVEEEEKISSHCY